MIHYQMTLKRCAEIIDLRLTGLTWWRPASVVHQNIRMRAALDPFAYDCGHLNGLPEISD